jgi:peptidyl-Lys metalloendopeptidase
MLDDGSATHRRKALLLFLPTLAACAMALAGCRDRSGVDSGDQDSRNKGPVVTCELRCEWTSEGLVANLSFKNVSDGDVKILDRSLLAGDEATELTWSPFEVTHHGARVPYAGKVVKRAAPTNADYHTLTPGEVVNATVNITSAYNLSAPGAYRVRYASVNFSPDGAKRIDIASNSVDITKPGSQ